MKFIYVFNHNVKEKLISLNYKLLKEDKKNNVYVFENKCENSGELCFSLTPSEYIFSNTLTF